MAVVKFDPNDNRQLSNRKKAELLFNKLDKKAEDEMKKELDILIRDVNICLQNISDFKVITEKTVPVYSTLVDLLSSINNVFLDTPGNPHYNSVDSEKIRNTVKKEFIKKYFPKEFEFVRKNS
nr:MAG TPA: Maternal effect protein oskar'-UTR, dimerization, RNA BINDING PROTEIN [Caudoviricetes sp.]